MKTATLLSTTGTAPIVFERTHGGLIAITLDDGSTQVYDPAALVAAVEEVTK